ncbi:MAG: alpha-L-rhamnosidase C-terminal domain-containing protein [Mycobacteriales bacterium]
MIRPVPGGDITWAEAELDSPFGLITSSWRIEAETFTFTATVLPGATAEVRLPDGRVSDAGPGSRT